MVNTYKELLEKWGDIDRSEMSFEEELDYVADWYNLAENLPTKPFDPNFTDYKEYKGQPFTILGNVSYVLDGDNIDLESLPLWKIEMPDGNVLWADCNEIFDWDKIEEV